MAHYGAKEELVIMKNKKLIALLALPLLMLSACSNDVQAKPTDYDDNLVVNTGSDKLASDVYNNIKSIIYDAMRDGGTLSNDVLNEVLYQISISVYGRYADISKVAEKINAGTVDETVTTFINDHKAFHLLNEDGDRINGEEAAAKERYKVVSAFNRIEKGIAKTLYNKISSSYTRDGYFYETDFLMSLRNTVKNVANPLLLSDSSLHDRYIVVPELLDEEVFTYEWEDASKLPGLLNRDLYEDETKGYDYISKEIIPEIYRQLLVEQYLFEESYNTLGRAYAREVNIISISSNSDYPLLAGNLMNAYVDTYINTDDEDLAQSADFSYISKAWRGIGLDVTPANDGDDYQRAAYLLEKAGSTYETFVDTEGYTGDTYEYWTGTSYGDMIENLKEITKNPLTTDSSIESDFTSSGTYTVAQGVAAKELSITKEDYTTVDWAIKNGGLSSLNDTIRNRLFNIGVANALDKEDYPDRFSTSGYAIDADEGNYVAKIHGRYFLKPLSTERVDIDDYSDVSNRLKDILWFNKDSSTYTIVEITEAVSSSKLSKTSSSNYETVYGGMEGFEKQEDIAHQVAEEIAAGDSYKSLSTKYWLEEAVLKYHDTVIYDYFVDNYPDLFD